MAGNVAEGIRYLYVASLMGNVGGLPSWMLDLEQVDVYSFSIENVVDLILIEMKSKTGLGKTNYVTFHIFSCLQNPF